MMKTKKRRVHALLFFAFLWSLLYLGFWSLATFIWVFMVFMRFVRKIFYKKPTFFDHLAIFILKVGSPRSQYSCGFPGFVATFPLFFFNLLLLKINNIYNKWQIKVGFWPLQYLVQNFAKNTRAIMKRIRIGD